MVLAGLVVPAVATCGGEGDRHERRRSDGEAIWFWRHEAGAGDEHLSQYSPVRVTSGALTALLVQSWCYPGK